VSLAVKEQSISVSDAASPAVAAAQPPVKAVAVADEGYRTVGDYTSVKATKSSR
jgi:hypothetical protein